MPFAPRRKHELVAIISFLAGVFTGLALLPWDVTGPIGRGFGRNLWKYLGLGGALIPMLGIITGLAGFGRFRELGLRRAAVLLAGLVPLVPFAVALMTGIRVSTDLPASYEDWTVVQQLVGMIPTLVAVEVISIVGVAGAVILGVISLSGLTLYTVDWHLFRKLAPGERKAKGEERVIPASRPVAPPSQVPDDPPVAKRPHRIKRKAAKPEEALDELPPIEILEGNVADGVAADDGALEELGEVLIETLGTFKVEGRIVGRTTGPVVTQFEIKPAPGVKVGKIAALADDLALAMRAKSIRIVAPIPGKAAVGVEVPNPTARMVTLRELLETRDWDTSRSVLPVVLGKDLEGKPRIADLAKMPHLLIAGATGSGKSVCINTIITSLVYRYTPRELRMLMIDPKMVELSMYNTLPHLRHPVVTDNKQAAQTLKWAMREMELRYKLFHANTARNMNDFNRKIASGKEMVQPAGELGVGSGTGQGKGQGTSNIEQGTSNIEGTPHSPLPYEDGPLPYIVIIVDELADLMMTVQGEVEKPLAILAQKARATGIHLILATQRPSVNVITGLIKANFPSRIAFRVASKVDSRTILDQNGAESLLGNGDMLFLPPGKSEPIRVQGAFIRTEETEELMAWYSDRKAERDAELERKGLMPPESGEEDILKVVAALEAEEAASAAGGGEGAGSGDWDVLFREAAETCISNQLGSTSLLQRKLRIGYGRAARIIDQLYEAGILGPPDGSKAREVLIGMAEIDQYCD